MATVTRSVFQINLLQPKIKLTDKAIISSLIEFAVSTILFSWHVAFVIGIQSITTRTLNHQNKNIHRGPCDVISRLGE